MPGSVLVRRMVVHHRLPEARLLERRPRTRGVAVLSWRTFHAVIKIPREGDFDLPGQLAFFVRRAGLALLTELHELNFSFHLFLVLGGVIICALTLRTFQTDQIVL